MLAHLAMVASAAEDHTNAPVPKEPEATSDATVPLAKRAKKGKRCGECDACLREEDCNACKYCLDKPKLGGNNTLRRQCLYRVCTNKAEGYSADDIEVSAYTQECLELAIAHGEATAGGCAAEGGAEPSLATAKRAQLGSREAPSISGLPPPPANKRVYNKSAPGRPTHTAYQKAVMTRYFEFNKLPDTQEREALGKALGLTPRAVQVWFQNRRQRQKEAKEARTAMQPAISLPALDAALPSVRDAMPQRDASSLPSPDRLAAVLAQSRPQHPPHPPHLPPHPSLLLHPPACEPHGPRPDVTTAALSALLPPTATGPDSALAAVSSAVSSAIDIATATTGGAGPDFDANAFARAIEGVGAATAAAASGVGAALPKLPLAVPPVAPPPAALPLVRPPAAPPPAAPPPAAPPAAGAPSDAPSSAVPALPIPSTSTDAGYGAVLLEAYANLPLMSRAALPRHLLLLICDAYKAMPLAQRVSLPPHVVEMVEMELQASQMRGLGLAAAREALALQAAAANKDSSNCPSPSRSAAPPCLPDDKSEASDKGSETQ